MIVGVNLVSGHARTYFILFASSVIAALQNVTVDDAVLSGTVVPQYLPSASSWNQGNNCSSCLAKPDPSRAYNGTWHDATFHPNSGISQEIEFNFTGSALYIFFIFANSIPSATTLTDVVFYLDASAVGTFVHSPSTSTDYEYNVPVYVNESVAFGDHNMKIEPVNSENSVLMLFDYLIYTTDTDNIVTSTSTSSFPTLSPTAGTQGSDSHQNTAAIVGGIVGGITALLIAVASLLYYWMHKKRKRLLPLKKDGTSGSLISLDHSITTHPVPSHLFQPKSTNTTSPVTLSRPQSPPISINPPSTASLYGNNTALLEQVELLREEVSGLRYMQKLRTKAASGSS